MVLFVDLPYELVCGVLSFVGPDDLAAIERVCHKLHDRVAGNGQLHKAVYSNFFDPPSKGMNLDWEREIRDFLRLKSICLSKDPKRITQLPFVHEVAKRILSHSTAIDISVDPDTLVEHRTFRNARILRRLLSPYPKNDSFVCQSWLYERARYMGPSADDEKPEERPVCTCGRRHAQDLRRITRSQTKKGKDKAKEPFYLPRPRREDTETHARRQMSAELQCLLGMPSLVCPPATSTSDKHGEEGDVEFVMERYSRIGDSFEGWGFGDPYGYRYDDEFPYDDDFDDFDNYDEDDEDGMDEDEGNYVDHESVYEDLDEGAVASAGGKQASPDHESVAKGNDNEKENANDDEDEEDDEEEDDEEEEKEEEEKEEEEKERPARRHDHFGSYRMIPPEKSLNRDMYPLAAAKVYDMRENTDATRWGPFQADGSGLVDWERMEALLIVLRYNVLVKGLLRFPAVREFWNTPFAGSWPSSYMPMLHDGSAGSAEASRAAAEAAAVAAAITTAAGAMAVVDVGPAGGESTDDEELSDEELSDDQIRALDAKDPYGISGTWMRIVSFLDYTEFFTFNFTAAQSADLPMPPLDQDEELRLIIMQIHATSVEQPGPDDHPAYPVVHFKGRSYAMDAIWDDNANSDLQGTVRTTKEGQVHWTLFSMFQDDARWRSEGIQVGGHKSGRGVVGTWFDSDFNDEGPCGPTAFWKMHERGVVRSLGGGGAFSYLLANTVQNNVRIVINVNHPFGQTIEVSDMVLGDPLTHFQEMSDYNGPMPPLEDASFSSVE